MDENCPKKKIAILSAGNHIAYSPTVIQLYEILSRFYTVTILAGFDKNFINQKIDDKNIEYYENEIWVKPSYTLKVKYFFLRRFNTHAKRLEAAKLRLKMDYSHFRKVKNFLKKTIYHRVIAVDVQNLFYCSVLNIKADFISLELGIGEDLLPFIKRETINCVITQSLARYQYLFKQEKLTTFFVQNAPVFEENYFTGIKKGLLYGGTAWDAFGFYHCLKYLSGYKDETLTVQGAVMEETKKIIIEKYNFLIQEKRLFLNSIYLDNKDVVGYFAQFEIGICFYNFDVDWVQHFNYESAPSGKIFKYLAAGVPVLAVDITGFKFIDEMACGVLIKDLSTESIRAGIEKIRGNYNFYAANTITAAKHFSFDKAVQPYIDYLEKNIINTAG